ncbi:MAG: tetratricopeptide repeat protein, partial [Acidobacteriota bacterium]|nr:tetratricopeptide repeat protein [Acidobacteriota bacterium]
MAFDKAKTLRAAEKFLAQGKIPSAVQEYSRIAEHDREDVSILNTLGDLYARLDKKQDAAQCFKRVADHYREQGFTVKAIAVYKKVTRINPGDAEVAGALAALYEQQGLVVEARAQYLTLVDAYTRAGQTREMLEVLRRLAGLDPNNTEIRLRLADGLMSEGQSDTAAAAFTEVGDRFASRGDHGRALDVYAKALAAQPHNYAALHGLVSTHAALGTIGEAAEILEQAVSANPGDVELRALLSRAYVEAKDAPKAEEAVDWLVGRDPANYVLFFDVARLYIQQGDVDKGVSLVGRTIESALAGRDDDAVLSLLNEAISGNPDHIPALHLQARIYSWQRNDEDLGATLNRMAEAASRAGRADEERDALSQLVRLLPHETRFHERLEALGGTPENASEMAVEEFHHAASSSDEVPTFESFMIADEPSAPSAIASGAFTEAAPEFEWNTVEPPSPPASDPSSSFADLNDFADTTRSEIASGGNAAAFQEIDFTATAGDPFSTAGDVAPSPAGAALLKQELESVDFYLAQNYHDIARDTLDMLERQYGVHPDIDTRRCQLPDNAKPAPALDGGIAPAFADASSAASAYNEPADGFDVTGVVIETSLAVETPASPANASQSSVAPTPPSKPGIDPGLAAIFDEFREAVEEEEAPAEDYETHYNLGLA